MNVLTRLLRRIGRPGTAGELLDEQPKNSREAGYRTTDESRIRQLYSYMIADPSLRAAIFDIRHMHHADGRVKKVHVRTARAATKGGLVLRIASKHKRIVRAWLDFELRLGLWNRQKLVSDMMGLMMEGNLPMQWVLGPDNRVVAGVRMPTETIKPLTGEHGRFLDPQRAYEQWDLLEGRVLTTFPLWALTLLRLTPDNYDDLGCLGRPYLDASRSVWRKLTMTEDDLVLRRRERAPMRTAHFLEGATSEELETYKQQVEGDQKSITTNFYSSKKGSVQAVQGDANLDQIADVSYLLDTFFSGAPAPKALFGYVGDLNRDILEDLKQDYFDELDAMQETAALAYEVGFRLDLLLAGINPDAYDFDVQFAERRIESLTQAADRALKLRAVGVPYEMCWKVAGLDPAEVREQIQAERDSNDPYPDDEDIPVRTRRNGQVTITPGQGGSGESGTDIRSRSA
jgi:hypothetical protein